MSKFDNDSIVLKYGDFLDSVTTTPEQQEAARRFLARTGNQDLAAMLGLEEQA